jgi:hypothetical protein
LGFVEKIWIAETPVLVLEPAKILKTPSEPDGASKRLAALELEVAQIKKAFAESKWRSWLKR